MDPGGTQRDDHELDKPEKGFSGRDRYLRYVRFREAFEFAPDAQLTTDANGLILEANQATSVLFHCPQEFLRGKPLALFGSEHHRQRFYEAIWRLRQGVASDAFESRVVRRDDGTRDVQVFAHLSGGGEPASLHWILRDVTDWRRSEAARAELQHRLTTAQEDERKRFARDLHDTTGQLLTALSLGVRSVQDAGPLPGAASARLDHVQRLVDDLARQVHELATRLRPTALDDLGLEAAVRHLAANWSARTGVKVEYQAVGVAERFPAEVETVLFRVIQEALTNVAKHAHAQRVAVVIGQNDEGAVAVVEDDGVGFVPENVGVTPAAGRNSTGGRLGLLGMRERVALVGGRLEIESSPDQGATIIARIPLGDQPGGALS